MREILFRGKRINKGDWVEGKGIDLNFGTAYILTKEYDCGSGYYTGEFEVIPETVGEWTGLTDKNGKKIFEGDILKGSWDSILVIFYDKISTSYRVKTSTGHDREPSYYGVEKFEVIGNIHDNPELMKGESK